MARAALLLAATAGVARGLVAVPPTSLRRAAPARPSNLLELRGLSPVSRKPSDASQRAVARRASSTPTEESSSAAVGRRVGVLGLWAALIAYAALGAPGHDAASQAVDSELLATLVSDPFDPTVNPLFCVLFNFMGLWPAVYAALLWPGALATKDATTRTASFRLPAAPFLLGSVALGMFSLAPYVALREVRAEGVSQATLGPFGRVLESKVFAGALALGAAALAAQLLGSTPDALRDAAADFAALFQSQLFVHVTSLDFSLFWLLSVGVLREDLARRGADERLAYLAALVPIYGHLAYLLIRPRLPSEEEPRGNLRGL